MNRRCPLAASPLAVLACFGVAATATAADGACVSSKLTRSEAEQLVLQVPPALAIQASGGKVNAMEWRPAGPYGRTEAFFYYFSLQRPRLETLPLQSNLVGRFAVNAYSARVVSLDTQSEVDNAALVKLQTQLRAKHCIGLQLVQENAQISP